MPRPRNQFTTKPSVLPIVATARSSAGSPRPETIRPASTTSDETGRMVAARSALMNSAP
jgi:hypothetical protein